MSDSGRTETVVFPDAIPPIDENVTWDEAFELVIRNDLVSGVHEPP